MTEVSPLAPRSLHIDPMALRKAQNVVYVRPNVRNQRQSWILDSTMWIPDSRFWIQDSLLLELQ